MVQFQPGFYTHFKGGFFLAYGVGVYGVADLNFGDVLFATGMYHEFREGDQVKIYRRQDGSFLVQGSQPNGLKVIIYQELYGKGPFSVREVDLFLGEKEFPDGKKAPRFTYLGTDMPETLKGK